MNMSELARKLTPNVTPQSVQQWMESGRIPPKRILGVCEAVNWMVTPHELDPDLYPHPDDGLPVDRRGAA